MTLPELRVELAGAKGRAMVNGLPYVDGSRVLCHLCHYVVGEQDEIRAPEDREGGMRWFSVSHTACSAEFERMAERDRQRAEQPALTWLLAEDQAGREFDGTPFVCSRCPFATANPEHDQPNPADPGEGYYDCALLDREEIWDESPECTAADWRARARAELEGLRSNTQTG